MGIGVARLSPATREARMLKKTWRRSSSPAVWAVALVAGGPEMPRNGRNPLPPLPPAERSPFDLDAAPNTPGGRIPEPNAPGGVPPREEGASLRATPPATTRVVPTTAPGENPKENEAISP